MKITIVDSGFVAYDTVKPIGYAGEMNSRQLEVIHPHFKDCYYQLIVVKDNSPYTLSVSDGFVTIPPSLLRTAGTMQCQFIAMSEPTSVINAETDTFVFKSQSFSLRVDEGLNLGGITPVPTYETLQQMYKDVEAAKAEVDKAKLDNEAILRAIQEALNTQQQLNQAGLDEKYRAIYESQIKDITNQYFDQFVDSVIDEVVARIADYYPPRPCPCPGPEPYPTPCPPQPEIDINQLKQMITQIVRDNMNNLKNSDWYSKKPHHSMSTNNNIIGG